MFDARLFSALAFGLLTAACDHSDPTQTADDVGVDSAPTEIGIVDSTIDSTTVDSTPALDTALAPDTSVPKDDTYVELCDAITTKYSGSPVDDAGFLDTGADAAMDGDAEAGLPSCGAIEVTGFRGLFSTGDTLHAINDCLYRSTDGSHWTQLPKPPGYLVEGFSGNPVGGYVVSKNKLWALTWALLSDSGAGWGETQGLYRLDGATWTFVSRPMKDEALNFGGGDEGFVLTYDKYEVASDGSHQITHLVSSTDGLSFSDSIAHVWPKVLGSGLTVFGEGQQPPGVSECDQQRAVIERSTDGATWTKSKTTPTPLLSDVQYGGVVAHDDQIAMFALRGTKKTTIAVSTDRGASFQLSDDTHSINGIATNGKIFVMVGDAGTILTSDDLGKPWVTRTSGTSARLTSVAAFGTGFVATAPKDGTSAAVFLQSPDGITWTAKPITPLGP